MQPRQPLTSVGTCNVTLLRHPALFATILCWCFEICANVALYMQVGLYVLLPVAFVQLYTYMLKQRSKRLAGQEKRR